MSRHRTFPKENQKKLNGIIRDLKALVRKQQKEINFLNSELLAIMRPTRDRKDHVEKDKLSYDAWRKDFVKRFKKDVLGEKD